MYTVSRSRETILFAKLGSVANCRRDLIAVRCHRCHQIKDLCGLDLGVPLKGSRTGSESAHELGDFDES